MLKNKIPDLESSSVSLAIVQNANVVSDSVGNYNDNNSDTVANNNINDQSNGGWGEGDVAYTPYDATYGMHSDSSDGSDNEGDHNKNVKKNSNNNNNNMENRNERKDNQSNNTVDTNSNNKDNEDYDNDIDGFESYASILHENSVLDEQSLMSETPLDMKSPRSRAKDKRNRRRQGDRYGNAYVARHHGGNSHNNPGRYIDGRLTNDIAQGSITSIVRDDAKLEYRLLEKQLNLTSKKLQSTTHELSSLKRQMQHDGVIAEFDRLNLLIDNQKKKIRDLSKANDTLEIVNRKQAKALDDAENKIITNGKSSLYSEKQHSKVLQERVKRLQKNNMQLRERSSFLENRNKELEGALFAAKNNSNNLKAQLRQVMSVKDGDGNHNNDNSNYNNSDLNLEPTGDSHSKERTIPLRIAHAMQQRLKEVMEMLRQSENDKKKLKKQVHAQSDKFTREKEGQQEYRTQISLENEELRNELDKRNKEAKMHVVTVKKLMQTCKELYKGNQRLQDASVVYQSALNIAAPPISMIEYREQGSKFTNSPPKHVVIHDTTQAYFHNSDTGGGSGNTFLTEAITESEQQPQTQEQQQVQSKPYPPDSLKSSAKKKKQQRWHTPADSISVMSTSIGEHSKKAT